LFRSPPPVPPRYSSGFPVYTVLQKFHIFLFPYSYPLTFSINSLIRCSDFFPCISTPLLTSTPKGRQIFMACSTFSGERPPARNQFFFRGGMMFQSKVSPFPPGLPFW